MFRLGTFPMYARSSGRDGKGTPMSAEVPKLAGVCRQLRTLEEAIAAQRRTIVSLEARKAETASARARLAQLLEQLDRVLAGGDIEVKSDRAVEGAA